MEEETKEEKNKIPETLDEAVFQLINTINKEDKTRIIKGELNAIAGHHTIGRGIRNSWGLWSGSKLRDWFVSRGIQHADDMSGIIFKKFEAVLREEEFNLEEEIKYYRNYWRESGVDPDKIITD